MPSIIRWIFQGRRGRLAPTAALLICAAMHAGAVAGSGRPAGGDLAIDWRLVKVHSGSDGAQASARLTLANRGQAALPAAGWSLYFTSLTPVVTGESENLITEQVVGTLFRLRPGPEFHGLAPGETLAMDLVHSEPVVRPDKAPRGAYLAYDDSPTDASAIGSLDIVPGLPPVAVADERGGGVDPAQLYAGNAAIRHLDPSTLPLALPTPLLERHLDGQWLVDRRPTIIAPAALRHEAHRLRQMFAARVPASTKGRTPTIRLAVARVPGHAEAEAYQLHIDARRGLTLSGNSAAGVARGLETLRQLLPITNGQREALAVPAVDIVDAPRFGYRGLMVDVARNFQRKESLFRLLELMAQFKLNRLHLHLADDEGWRLAIRGLPELTDYGARRGHARDEAEHLLPAHGSGPNLDDPHGSGYYRAEDFIAILKYAARRHIEVIPELEMPGHARAAVKAMAYRARLRHAQGLPDADAYLLADPADTSRYRSAQLHTDNVMDPGLESTYHFVDHVIGEVARLYRRAGVPLTMIHVGGDELAQGAWEGSPACRRLMAREHLASIADLWDHFYGRVTATVARTGAGVAGWEELGMRDGRGREPAPSVPNPLFAGRGFQLLVWNNLDDADDLANRLANAGYHVVLAPATRFYFDMAHAADLWEPGADWAGYSDLANVYDLVPFDLPRQNPADTQSRPGRVALQGSARANILGLEATLFSEIMREPAGIDSLLMPRLLALAERAWAADPEWARTTDPARAQALHDADWSRFVNVIGQRVLPRLDAEWPDLQYRLPPPGLKRDGERVDANLVIPGVVVRYTTDGSDPTATSPVVAGPLITPRTVSAAAFSRNGRHGRVVRSNTP